MRFLISHETIYAYANPASESVGELRICPVDTKFQKIQNRKLILEPDIPVESYQDYFGNTVECFAVPFRHKQLRVRMEAEVTTIPRPAPASIAEIPFGQARRLSRNARISLYLYRLPTPAVPLGVAPAELGKRFFRESKPLRDCLLDLNSWIYNEFEYCPGVTDVSTPLETIIQDSRGVCQDFAHLMLSILRTNGLVARYVSGYIEPTDPTIQDGAELIGAAASHAWVEVHLADGTWWGLDPTNNQSVGERHVKISVGRDYHDVAPLRGSYKGATSQKLQVIVSMQRTGRS
ncbi:transglutaminase family protein [Puniceicoccales bacterium CK1056]|uniref:Transglutaminase family protein n=1 Tax=Oceanipulchritudo coccoides TaxID=2706888 RepID=A0A6B2M0A7_9BACT|nr:transglutaminase family protein [Oceanipulchritudo coccoides]NDV61180.1 transglutaminase family protein [Oceanipulchritudo coccoides]